MSVKMERGHEWAILSSPRATMSTMANPEKANPEKWTVGRQCWGDGDQVGWHEG